MLPTNSDPHPVITAHYFILCPQYTQILSQALSVHPLNYRAVFHKATSEIILTPTNVHIVIKHGIRYTVATTQPGEARPSNIQVFFFLNQHKVQHYFIGGGGDIIEP